MSRILTGTREGSIVSFTGRNTKERRNNVHTGDIIKALREQANMTQAELGKQLGVNKSTVQKYENGMVQNLKIKTLRKLCEIFVVPPWQFIYPEHSSISDEQIVMKIRQTLLLAKIYQQLTKEGQTRVYHYLRDLSEIQHYKSLNAKTIKGDLDQMRKLLVHQDAPKPVDVLNITWRDITGGHAPSQAPDEP